MAQVLKMSIIPPQIKKLNDLLYTIFVTQPNEEIWNFEPLSAIISHMAYNIRMDIHPFLFKWTLPNIQHFT